MDITFNKPRLGGSIRAISSKSEAHRQLICAALSDVPTKIICNDTNNDINATASCLNSLGAKIERCDDGFIVEPIATPKNHATLDCGESGSTLRFLQKSHHETVMAKFNFTACFARLPRAVSFPSVGL